MFFVGLTNSVGGFEQIAPDAKLDDGKFTLIIVKKSNIFELMRLAAELLNGKHLDDPNVIYVKTSQIKVDPIDKKERLMINLDGEYGGDAPVRFKNLHNHIEIFANIDEIRDGAVIGNLDEEDETFEIAKDNFIHEFENVTKTDIDDDGKIG